MKIKITLLLFFIGFSLQAQITVKGKVTDEANNPLPYVNVLVKDTTIGTITDDEGYFSLRLDNPKNTDVIEISLLGFKTESINFNSKITFFKIKLKEENDFLDEVVLVTRPKKRLKKKENPAYKILKEVWKRKRKNGLKLVDYYQYRKYTTTEIGLNNVDTAFVKKVFKDEYLKAFDNITYDSDGKNYYIPVYLKEQVNWVYGNNKTKKIKEDIEAEKEVGASGFAMQMISNVFKNIDIFKNNITILRKSFISPLSTEGFATYDYVLHDTVRKNNKKFFNIYFFPRREQDFAFTGNVLIAEKNYSVKKIRMEVGKSAGINFARGLSFEKEFDVKKDSIYISTKDIFEGDFTVLSKDESNRGASVKKTINYNNYKLNKPKPASFYDIKSVKIRPNQYDKNDSYWKIQNQDKKDTYDLIQNVVSKKAVRRITGLINTLATGYVRTPFNLELGPFWTAFASNEIEGFRTKLAFRTFKTKDDRFRFGGHIAYGFKDKKIKYGAEAKYLLSFQPRITTSIAYQKDIEQLGSTLLNTNQLLGNSFGNTAVFIRGNNYFLSNVEKYATNFDYAFNNNLHLGINFSRAQITSASPENFSIEYKDENGTVRNQVNDVASDIYLSFTPGRNVYGLGVQQRYGRNIYPSIILNYRHGYKDILGGTHNYDKIQIRYNQPIMLGSLGLLDATIEGGKTFGEVPISLLSPIPANQSFSLVKNTFALMNYYDFVTDTYLAGHFEQHFNGFLLNRIPIINKLKLRSLLTFRAAYGTISNANRNINLSDIQYNAPSNKLYYEYGVGIENIGFGNLRFLRVDAIWRSDYTIPNSSIVEPTPKFAIRIAIRPGS